MKRLLHSAAFAMIATTTMHAGALNAQTLEQRATALYDQKVKDAAAKAAAERDAEQPPVVHILRRYIKGPGACSWSGEDHLLCLVPDGGYQAFPYPGGDVDKACNAKSTYQYPNSYPARVGELVRHGESFFLVCRWKGYNSPTDLAWERMVSGVRK